MIKTRNVQALLAIAAVALLPACSKIMGGERGGQASYQGSSPAASALAPDTIRQVQSRLRDDGYYKQGAVDGLWGDGTQTAVRNFQRDHSIAATGSLDVATLTALNLTSDRTTGDRSNPTVAPDRRAGTADNPLPPTERSTTGPANYR
jgi:peptidoglycan hydrolase-like protein with peptidoglycan-binding domain